jgi:hypothetical protein
MEDSFTLAPQLQSLPEEPLTGGEAKLVRRKLYGLLSFVTARYTMDESSSVPVETARELLESLTFTLTLALRAEGRGLRDLAGEAEPEKLLERGRRELKARFKRCRALYAQTLSTLPPMESISLRDTMDGLGVFFRRYDLRYFAHLIPADIDYQLCRPVPESFLGVEYVGEYLRRLLMENLFLSRFETKTVTRLLEAYCPDYRELPGNLFEPAGVNAVGLALYSGDIFSLDVKSRDLKKLEELFRTWSREEAEKNLSEAAGKACQALAVGGPAELYLASTARELYPRIMAALPAGGLGGIFLSLGRTAI